MKNYDPAELKKFSEMAHQWWDENGSCAPLHAINPLRLEFIKQQINLDQLKILDVGCGGGILTEALAKSGAKTTGIDLSSELIKVAKLHLHESKLAVHYELMDIAQFATNHPLSFDGVVCMEMLEHVPEPEAIIKNIAQCVKPGGHVFFSTINRNLKAYFFAVIGAEYVLNILPRGTHDYNKFIRPAELAQWARGFNLELKKMIGLTYQPLKKRYVLCDNIDVNYLAYFRKSN